MPIKDPPALAGQIDVYALYRIVGTRREFLIDEEGDTTMLFYDMETAVVYRRTLQDGVEWFVQTLTVWTLDPHR